LQINSDGVVEERESGSDFRKRIAFEWKNMTAEEKKPYIELSEKVELLQYSGKK
jgi:hypothetical protein